jgi:cytochrome P450
MDPEYFPDPELFRPERWLGPDATQLEGRLITFSRGPRSCIGINLAHTELYLGFAYVFRKFDLALHETTAADMEWKDNFVVTTKGHLKVTTSRRVDDK